MKKSIYLTLCFSLAVVMTAQSQKVVVKTCSVCKKSLPECSYHGNHPKTPVLKGVKVIIPPIYGFIGRFKDGLAPYSPAGSYKYGFIDQQGKIVIPAKYDNISAYDFDKDGLCEVYQKIDAKGLIDKTGKVVVPLRYSDTYITLDGKRWLKQGENYFRLDKDGKILPCKKYDKVSISRDSPFVKVCQNGKWGVVDGEDTEIVPCTFDEKSIKIGVYLIALRGEKGFAIYDSKGQKVNDGPYDFVKISPGIVIIDSKGKKVNEVRFSSVERNGYEGLIDQKSGKEVAPCRYSYMSSTVSEDGYRLVKRSGNCCYIDLEGHEITHSGYNVNGKCSNGIIPAQKKGKYGYLTIDGKVVVDCVYESVSTFEFGYGVVQNQDKRGVVDSTGKVLFECKYDKVEIVDAGLAIAQTDKQYFVLNLESQQEIPVDGEKLRYQGEHLFETSIGLLSSEGKTVVPADRYDFYRSFEDGLALVYKNWKWGAIDKHGHEVIPCQFTEEFHFDDGMAIVNVGGTESYLWKHGVIAKPELSK